MSLLHKVLSSYKRMGRSSLWLCDNDDGTFVGQDKPAQGFDKEMDLSGEQLALTKIRQVHGIEWVAATHREGRRECLEPKNVAVMVEIGNDTQQGILSMEQYLKTQNYEEYGDMWRKIIKKEDDQYWSDAQVVGYAFAVSGGFLMGLLWK
ncbi:hypothetical protein BGW36DRAFT_362956 [Talaromyces proteolyticus]|uniref:Uncharacterized protein n=1 Tax=Talaromyces proteolyticus TaxID=1131652 RepID=A0AAD4KIK0_9EURO|nr:uncharacterized protein BGW36DRAFT_362956 [Talaromyces proteolyticus]KAH8691929.1 hypothetical protein BGW36DRAFT_362956 [Talaromyces proteolyticus]